MNSTFLENYCPVSHSIKLFDLFVLFHISNIYVYLLGFSVGLKWMEANKAKHMDSEEVDEACSRIYEWILDWSKQYVSQFFIKDIASMHIVVVTIIFKGTGLTDDEDKIYLTFSMYDERAIPTFVVR